MKTGVLLFFIGALIALTLLFVGIQALVVLGSSFDHAQGPVTATTVFAELVDSGPAILLAAALCAAPLGMFRLLGRPRRPTLPLLVLFVLVAGVLYGGSLATRYLAARVPPAAGIRVFPPEGSFLTTPDRSVYVDERFGDHGLQRVLVHIRSADADAERFSFHRRAVFVPELGVIEFQDGTDSFSVPDSTNAPWRMFEPPASVRGLNRDLGVAASLISDTIATDLIGGIAAVLALSFVLTASWVFVRLTRWPLFNTILVIGWVRLLVAGIPLPASVRFIELIEPVLGVPVAMRGFYLPAMLILVGLLLLVVNAILPSFDHWRREVHGV